MKKNLPYILMGVILAAVIAVFVINNRSAANRRRLDERLTLYKRDKIPYGLSVAYESLTGVFPKATVSSSSIEPGLWNEISSDSSNQALVIITSQFNADKYEMQALASFVENGNDVFLSTCHMSREAETFLKLSVEGSSPARYMPVALLSDTLTVRLSPPLPPPDQFTFPGKKYVTEFDSITSSVTRVLGVSESGRPQFVQLRIGRGRFFVHLAPIAFSNYFLLHKSNMAYYERVLSMIPAGTSKVLWDEYYRSKMADRKDNKKKGWFTVLMNMKNSDGRYSFRAAMIVVMILLLLYVLLEMRRKQKIIPVIRKEANSSLDFTRTIGRLYHDKGDHNNLARKMTAYFLEHVRSRYKLVTTSLNDEFIKQLHTKTGVDEVLAAEIVQTINRIDQQQMSPQQLAAFHKQLETFYKTA